MSTEDSPRRYATPGPRDCDHCERPIVMLPVVWGSDRPVWAYEPHTAPIEDVHPSMRFAFSKGRGGVLRLESGLPADSPMLPRQSLVPHRCGRAQAKRDADGRVEAIDQYTQWMKDQIDAQAPGLGGVLMGYIKDGPAHTRKAPDSRGMGFRRGLGRRRKSEEDTAP